MSQIYIFDGAMGTMLQERGLEAGACPELLNLEGPHIVQEVHRLYLEAGAQILTTNTFGGTPLKLDAYGLGDRCHAINRAAVDNAKRAIEDFLATAMPNTLRPKIAGDMGPTGHFMAPLGPMGFDEIYEAYLIQGTALLEGGVDFLLIETMIDIQEMRAALIAAKDARLAYTTSKGLEETAIPIICQLAYSDDGRTVTGTDPVSATILLDAMGADIIGANCSLGPDQLLPLLEQMATVTNKPLIVQPNAGLPILNDKKTVFPLDPEGLRSFVGPLMEAGVTYLGGCCGTTPAHIQVLAQEAKACRVQKERPYVKPFTAFTSRTKTVFVGQDKKPIIIGERINPTGRNDLAQELREGRFFTVKKDAIEQVEAGAHVLDVNMGVPKVDQEALMDEAITTLATFVDAPLSIDTMDPKALEAALKAYPGRPLINSVNAEEEQLETIIPLAKRYGAALLCLPLGRGDLPATAEERLALAQIIVDRAHKEGLRDCDLLLDPLVLTLASGRDSAKETLKTLRLYKETFGFPTVMGLSNISFGLPQRPFLNGQFLTMAMSHGLTCPIMNPLNYTAKKAFDSARTLLGYDEAAKDFIAFYGQETEDSPKGNSGTFRSVNMRDRAVVYDPQKPIESIQHAVEQGEKESIGAMVEQALAAGVLPMDITKKGLSKAMEVVGEQFGSGKLFLPQVMLCAEAMQVAFQKIKEVLPSTDDLKRETIILATVKGDIHDLGKNIVGALLENNGYKVIDLGKDVEAERIIAAIKEHNATLVGLASLMTTTMPQIDATIEAIRKANLPVKIMVGGAVLTETYAAQAGADRYVRDGVNAVKVAKELSGNLK